MSEKEEKALDKKFDRILYILEDDPTTGKTGLVHAVSDIQITVKDILEREKINIAVKKGQQVIYGAIGGAIILIIEIIIKALPLLKHA